MAYHLWGDCLIVGGGKLQGGDAGCSGGEVSGLGQFLGHGGTIVVDFARCQRIAEGLGAILRCNLCRIDRIEVDIMTALDGEGECCLFGNIDTHCDRAIFSHGCRRTGNRSSHCEEDDDPSFDKQKVFHTLILF